MAEYIASVSTDGAARAKPAADWMVGLDLDGTVLDQHHQVRPDVRAEIAATRALGVRVVIVSARAPAAVRPRGFVGDEVVADHLDALLGEELRISGMTGHEADLLSLQQPVLRLMAIVAPGDEAVFTRMREAIGQEVSCILSHPQYLEVMHDDLSKGRALARLRERWQLGRETCIAMGDSDNDLSMFTEVDWPVAMTNGSAEVRAAAVWGTETNREGSVAVALRRFRERYWQVDSA